MKLLSPTVSTSAVLTSLTTSVPSVVSSVTSISSQATISTSLPPTTVLLSSLLQSIPSTCPSSSHSEVSGMQQPSYPLQLIDQGSVEIHCNNALVNLTLEQQFKVLSKLFSSLLQKDSKCVVPDNFLELAANGMGYLHKCDRSNVIYLLSQALGTMRSDQSDSLLPVKRMPMGLIEYTVNFFTADHINEVCTYCCLQLIQCFH